MVIQVGKHIGNTMFTFATSDAKTELAFAEATKIDRSISDKCGFCGGADLRLISQEKDEFTFVKILCLNPNCKATKKLGQNKTGGGWFFHDWVKYDPETKTEEKLDRGTTPAKSVASKETNSTDDGDDIPF